VLEEPWSRSILNHFLLQAYLISLDSYAQNNLAILAWASTVLQPVNYMIHQQYVIFLLLSLHQRTTSTGIL
jgi:hypothetical protein